MSNHYKCSPRQARKFVLECIAAGLVPFLQSSPGMGKSSIVKRVAKDFSLKVIDHRLSTSEPTDMTGLPRFDAKGFATFAPFVDLFPIAGTPLPPDKEGWLLFLDEVNAASRSVQAAAYKLILDRMVGQHRLHDSVGMVMAGNLASDRAITNPLSTAMQSRVVHLELEINFKEWLEDVALPEKYDKRIIGFLMQFNNKLMDFKPDHHELTFCCPRTWEFVNRLLTDQTGAAKPVTDETAILLSGTITSGVAMEFVQFTKVYASLLSIYDIRKDPGNCALPNDNAMKWAVITNMMDSIDDDNFDDLATYADRFDLSFRILFYRSILVRKDELRLHPKWGSHASKIVKYLAAP
jgi:hypothetical protein